MSLHHMLRAAAGNAGPSDPYFEYNTLLLTGDGTNGAQNNTFIDSSTNNFTITRNGNTTQGSFSPYGPNWSNYFDGSGDYLSTASNSALTMGTNDFTAEMWIYPLSLGVSALIDNSWSASADAWQITLEADGKITVYNANGAGATLTVTTTTSVSLNTWTHIAVVKSGTTVTIYLNGVSSGSGTINATFGRDSVNYIGAQTGSIYYYLGYISNLRIVKGTAVYTSNFTPPTTPLTAVSGTSLLTCQSNRFKDNSSNNFAITVNGNTSVQRFSPFNPTAPYSTSVIGGSGYFDGSGDYLTVSANSALNQTGDFTVEGWVYIPSAPTDNIPFYSFATTNFIKLGLNSSMKLIVDRSGVGLVFTGTTTVPLNAWNYVTLVRNGSSTNNCTVYLNGVQEGQFTYTTSTTVTGTGDFFARTDISKYMQGYLSNFRVTNSAVYTTAFTPPTAPLTAITNTSLLCNFTNAGIPDAAMMNDLETVGNAQVSTSVKKYGTGSLAFDGTGDYLTMPNSPNLQLGSGNFTVEFWMYPTSVTGVHQIINTQTGSTDVNLSYAVLSNGTSCVYYLSSTGTTWNLASGVSIGTIALNTWYHVALVRNGSTVTPYLNGVAGTTSSVSTTALYSFLGAVQIGRNGTTTTTDYAGYIDDLRITKGYARYTSSFTPPTAALPTY